MCAVLILRIRRAQTALADGRLDEAFGLAQAADLQAHQKGQRLIGRLARALVKRGRDHLAAGRWVQANADSDKAGALAGNLPELAELRTALADAAHEKQRAERHRGDVLAAAREHVDNGRLSIGEQWLERCAAESARIDRLREQVTDRRAQASTAIERAEAALAREDWPAAAAGIAEARRAHAGHPRCGELAAELARGLTRRAAVAIDQGRLDLADSLLEPARLVGIESVEIGELTRFLDQCREAIASIGRGRPRPATEVLRRLSAIRPGAAWLSQAAAAAQQAAENLESLRSGPLGLLSERAGAVSEESTLPPVHWQPRPVPKPSPAAPPAAGHLPARLLFHVDGVGSYLVVRDRRVTIGPAGSSRHPEVALLTEPGMPVATIERNDEDYFFCCEADARVNDAAARRKLLANGDRIALSARTRMRFVLPNAASTSAVLQLAGTRLPGSDARQVILLDREMVLGPGSTAHMRADALAAPAILHVRDGRLFCRAGEEVKVNDRPLDRHAGIPLGARVQVGPISFVVTAA